MKLFFSITGMLLASTALCYPAIPHRGRPGPSPAPVLTSTTVTFGRDTGNGYGGVRLSSQDLTMLSYIPFTFSGFGLMSPAGRNCADWTLTYDHNTVGRPGTDFTIPAAHTAEGSSAKTPVPSSTGVGHLDGDYYWNVVCQDSEGNISNTAQIIYHTEPLMANIGDTDFLDRNGVIPSGFGTTADSKIVFSTGMDRLNQRVTLKFPHAWTHTVTITVADSGRYPKMSNFGADNFSLTRWTDIMLSGSQTPADTRGQISMFTNADLLHDIEIDHNYYFGNQDWLNTTPQYSGQSFISMLSCDTNCVAHDNFSDFSQSGFAPTSNSSYINNMISHYFNNGLFIYSVHDVTVNDNIFSAPSRFSATHVDACQFADSAASKGLTMLRNTAVTAGGNTNTQGFCFAGGQINMTGYISDGSGSTSPGHILTKVTGSVSNSGIANTYIISPGALTVDDGVQILSPANGSGPWTLNIPGGDISLGSPGSPVTFYSPWGWNTHVSGIMNAQGGYHAVDLNGSQGTSSWTNGSYASQEADPFYKTSYPGTISGGILTIVGPITNSIPYAPEPYYIYGRLSYTGCDYCNASYSVGSQITSTKVRGTATVGISGSTMTVSAVSTGLQPAIGDFVVGAGISDTTKITSIPSTGYPIGSYGLSKTATVSSGTDVSINIPNQEGTYNTGSPATLGLQTITSSDSYPVTNNTNGGLGHCDIPEMWTGSFNISDIYIQNGWPTVSPCPPAAASLSNISSNTTLTASDFASGMLPINYLAAVGASVWDSYLMLVPDEAKKRTRARICLAFKPSKNGALGMHSAITPATEDDGSGGGDWIVDGVASTHIDGCEAIP